MASRTILLKGRGVRKEAKAGGTITPGHLVAINSSGALVVHNVAGGRAATLFAVENDLIGNTIDDNYVSGDYVQAEYLRTGDEVYGLVAANAAAIAVGDYLESAGDGTVRKVVDPLTAATGTGNGVVEDVGSSFTQATLNNNFKDVADAINALKSNAIAIALEAVDNNAGSDPARISFVLI